MLTSPEGRAPGDNAMLRHMQRAIERSLGENCGVLIVPKDWVAHGRFRAHIGAMTFNRPELFAVRPVKVGSGYIVVYSPDISLKEEIGGFASEIAAVNWITVSSAGWLQKRKPA